MSPPSHLVVPPWPKDNNGDNTTPSPECPEHIKQVHREAKRQLRAVPVYDRPMFEGEDDEGEPYILCSSTGDLWIEFPPLPPTPWH